jgi:nucleoside 2-deoxyribosyltransferase
MAILKIDCLSNQFKVLLASPSVFWPNAKANLSSLAALCERHILTPLVPIDDCASAADVPLARRIYKSNTHMLHSADGVLADLQELRGHEPDLGAAFDVGFAAALELPIVGYGAPVDCYADRVSKTRMCKRDVLGMLRECNSQMAVEDFGMPLSLRLGCSAMLVNSEEEGSELLAAMLRHGPASSRRGSFDNWLQARVLDHNTRKVSD